MVATKTCREWAVVARSHCPNDRHKAQAAGSITKQHLRTYAAAVYAHYCWCDSTITPL